MTEHDRRLSSSAVAIWILATVAVIWFLREARSLLIPIALGILISYALEPIVGWLERRGIKRLVGTTLMMLTIVTDPPRLPTCFVTTPST